MMTSGAPTFLARCRGQAASAIVALDMTDDEVCMNADIFAVASQARKIFSKKAKEHLDKYAEFIDTGKTIFQK